MVDTVKAEASEKVKEKVMKYKCPEFSGEIEEYDEWKVLVEDWMWMTKDEVKGQGVIMRQSVKGKARQVVLDIEKEVIRGKDGGEEVLKRLDEVYRKDKVWERYDKALAYLSIERKRNESIKDFLQRYEHVALECRKVGGKTAPCVKCKRVSGELDDELKAIHLLEATKLNDPQKQMVLSAARTEDLEYDVIRKVMKRMFENADKSNKADETWVEGAGRMGYRREADTWPEGAGRMGYRQGYKEAENRGARNPMRYGKVTRCAICMSEFHWARQCPRNIQNRGGNYGNAKKEQEGQDSKKESEASSKVFVSKEEDRDYWTEIEAILDTGCKNSVIGEL